MRSLLLGATALALLTACGGGDKKDEVEIVTASPEDVAAALADMALNESEAGAVAFDGSTVSDGKAVFNNFSAVIDEDEGLKLTADTLTLNGLHMTEDGGNFSTMAFENLKLADDGGDATMTIGALNVESPSPALGAWMADLMETGEPGEMPDLEELSFKTMNFSGLSFSGGDNEEDGTKGTMTIGSFALDGFKAGDLDKYSLDDLALSFSDPYEGMNFAAKVDLMEVIGLKKSQTQGFLIGTQSTDMTPEEQAAALSKLSEGSPLDPGYESVSVNGLDVNVNGIAITSTPIKANVDYNKAGVATASETEKFTMTMKADPSGQFGAQVAPILSILELDQVEMTSASKYKIDVAGDSMTGAAKDNYLEIKDVVTLSLGLEAGGLADYQKEALSAAGLVDQNPLAMLGALQKLQVGGFELGLDDQGLVEKALTMASLQMGQDKEMLRQQAMGGVAFLPAMAGQAGVDAVIAQELAEALRTFLENPGKLTLKLDPAEPLTGELFGDPTQLTKDRLGFSASAE